MTAHTCSADVDPSSPAHAATPPVSEIEVRTASIYMPPLPDPPGLARLSAAEVRRCFLLQDLFEPDRIRITHTDLDRASVGGAVPASGPLTLLPPPDFASDCFAQRREL